MSTRPLEGILVVDFTTMVAGGSCTRMLADCGAQVIKLEAAEGGDLMRRAGNVQDGVSLFFALYNAGKKSVVLDLKSPAGLEISKRLIERADIVVENFRPGVMARLGLDYETVSKINPKAVYCSISGFGQTGPLSQRAAYAPVAHAFSGFDMMLSRLPDREAPPPDNRVMIADIVAGAYAFSAIQTALVHRLRNGVGSHVDVAMADSMMTLVGMQIQQAQHDALWPSGGFPSYATKDGYVNIPLVSPITYRQALKVMGRDDILNDPEFQASPATRRVEIIEALRVWAAEHTSEECDTIMTAGGVPCAIYRMPHEVLDHPQTVARGSFTDVPTANGSFKILNPPFQISGAGVKAGTTVPALGEHTHDVLADILGLSEADLATAAGEKAFG